MNLGAVVVEQLEQDGYLRTFQMFAEPGHHLTVAFADDRENPRSGPFHFLDDHHEKAFEKGFAECNAGILPKSRFIAADGEGVFKHSWAGIPTERNSLSYYALSLPEFAVPTRVEFKDPHSGRPYSCSVIRDDRRNRFVAYLGCRSSRGSFDFLLQVSFSNDRANFRLADYSDQHTTRQDARIPSYEHLLLPDQNMAVARFFTQEAGPSQASPSLPFPPPAPIPSGQSEMPSEESKIQKPARPHETNASPSHKLPAKKTDLSRYFDGANLTEIQREVASLALEYSLPVAEIARHLHRDRKTIYEHLAAAKKRMEHSRSFERRAAKRSTNPE